MLFDGEIEFVQGLGSRRVFCGCAASSMIDLSQSSNDRFWREAVVQVQTKKSIRGCD
jgi:hypothetical protein